MPTLAENKNLNYSLAFVLQIFIFLVLCSIESVFFSPRNSFLEIDLWMASIIFMCLHRTLLTGLLFCALSSFFLSAFSGIPLYSTLLSFLSIFISLHLIKNRSFTQGASYFSICSFVSILTFYISYFALSWVFGDSPIESPHLINWITSALMSSALFVLIRPLLILSDSLFNVKYPFGFEVE